MSSPASDVIKTSLLVRAGAGAGKTTLLIKTFIDFCNEFEAAYQRLPRMAITTFTRKATQEVKERLSLKALENKDDKLFQHINKKSMVHISTIHGVLTMMVQENADLLDLPQTVKIIDQNLYKKNLKKIIRQVLKKNPIYLEILEHYSFVQLIDFVVDGMEALRQSSSLQTISVEEMQSITNHKLGELSQQLQQILNHASLAPEAWQSYFQFLQNLQVAIQTNSVEKILSCEEAKPTKPRWNKKNPAFAEEIFAALEEFWDAFDFSVYDTEDYFVQQASLSDLFLKLVQEISLLDSNYKSTSGEITINDLELFSLELVRNHPAAVADFSEKFDYYMIDEFQDTSPLQVEILDQIIGQKPHFIVGDPQQSIYLFRGARSEVFLLKQQKAAKNDSLLKLKFLDTNYRSEPSVMHFINDYFSHMSHQFVPMQTQPDKEISKSEISFIQAENEAAGVLQQIAKLLQNGVSPKDICVLSRRNQNLLKITALAQKVHIPVQLQISAGFDQKREILDLVSILKFLINPHDNENLILLLRSPWAYLSDSDIAAAAKINRSLWLALSKLQPDHATIKRLSDYFSDYQNLGVTEAFVRFIQVSQFLDYSFTYDSSGKREANYWKFFIHLKNAERNAGFSLGQYLSENFQFFQSDLGSSLSEAVPVAQPDRISLMTIHASKGLEFPHVIVVGFSEAPHLTLFRHLTISLEKQKLSLAPFVVSESKNVISRWGNKIRKDFNIKENEEHERLLYVALTRAKASLTLVAETKSRQLGTSWQKKSLWPETGLHEHQHYNLSSLQTTTKTEKQIPAEKKLVSVRKKLIFKNAVELSTSVTESLLHGSGATNKNINYEQKINDILKAKKGTDLHRLFESLQVFTQNSELFEALQMNLSSEQKKSIQYLLTLKEYPLAKLIKDGYVEFGFGLKTTTGLLQGQIDLWGIANNEIYILDYKTGSSAHIQKAYQQLLFYAHCLYKMNKIDFKMKLNFIVTYPLEQKTLSQQYANYEELVKGTPFQMQQLFI